MSTRMPFGEALEAQLAANRQVVQTGVASTSGRIWPQNSEEYGGPTPLGTRLQGQVLETGRDHWPSGDPRVKVLMRGEDGQDYNVTLSKYSLPAWEQSPPAVGDWIVFEVVSLRPAKLPGRWYVETAFATAPGTGSVTIPSQSSATPPDPEWGSPASEGLADVFTPGTTGAGSYFD